MGDLQGPKIRVGLVENDRMVIEQDALINLWSGSGLSTITDLYISYPDLQKDVKTGEKILIDDGKLSLEVVTVNEEKIVARVLVGGILSNRKGVNLPDTNTALPCITEKDEADLAFALHNQLDWIALSFVRSASDIKALKKMIAASPNHWKPGIIAKIEKPEGVRDIDSIIKISDAVMVARGDLGIEVPFEQVPVIQKSIIQKALQHARPVIVATQMLEGMISNTTPTRAEINDVANSVMDGADALMLSGETSAGRYPVEAVKAMKKIMTEIEKFHLVYHRKVKIVHGHSERFISDAIIAGAVKLSRDAEVTALITHTLSGYSAYKLASHRPLAKIYIFSHNQNLLNRLNLVWGVQGFFYGHTKSSELALEEMRHILYEKGLLQKDDLVIQMAGFPLIEKAKSNMMMLRRVVGDEYC